MRITKRAQEVYRAELDRLEKNAAAYVESCFNALRTAAPDASIAELREAIKEAISDALNAFGDQAGTLACELFDEITIREGIRADSQLYTDTIDPEMIDKKVRYFARDLQSDNGPSFVNKITDLTRFYIKRSAYENMIRNCDKNNIRYARVPSGRETCAFCFMLSSRGFVYHSELTAKGRGLHGMHNHCDCIIIPGVEGTTAIDGYDPDLMYERWKQCAETVGVDPKKANSFRYRQKVMDEVAKRDFKWLNSAEKDYRSKVGKQQGATPKRKEWDVAEKLARLGFETMFLKPVGKKGVHTADSLINGEAWEIKQPVGDKKARTIGKNTIDHQFEEASKQSRKMILDLSVIEQYEDIGYEKAAEKALELFQGKWKDRFDEILLYGESGIRRYKNA